jgi:DNA-binding NarL/FixJ family response regulator
MPDEGAIDRFRRLKIKSVVMAPLFVKEKLNGFVIFEQFQSSREWLVEDINLLKSAVWIICHYLEIMEETKKILYKPDHFRKHVKPAPLISHSDKDNSCLYQNLSPTEIKIAAFIKKGKTTKDMANILGQSVRTIEVHRHNIRKKLGIANAKVNLRTYLLTS